MTSTRWRLVLGVVGVAVVAAIFVFVLPLIADYGSVLDAVRGLTWAEVMLVAALAALSLAAFPLPLVVVGSVPCGARRSPERLDAYAADGPLPVRR